MALVRSVLIFSRPFDVGLDSLGFGRYTITVLPTNEHDEPRALLEFQIDGESVIGDLPRIETSIVAQTLALMCDADVEVESTRIVAAAQPNIVLAVDYDHESDVPMGAEFSAMMADTFRLAPNLVDPYMRSVGSYAKAIVQVGGDPSLAFMLLSISIETLANKPESFESLNVEDPKSSNRRFTSFVLGYVPLEDQPDKDLTQSEYRDSVQSVYRFIRSRYVHGGHPVNPGFMIADLTNSAFFQTVDNAGKEQKVPGLKWFIRVVRTALLKWVAVHRSKNTYSEIFRDYAADLLKIRVKAARAIEQGEPITLSDIIVRSPRKSDDDSD